MTFKEFFQKKKIDLALLGKERPQLLKEFQKHFEAMGEKSFDHTKKYWFNKLRKSYPLKEEPVKPATPAVLPSKTVGEKASEGEAPSRGTEPSGSGAPKPALGFKPRFKAGITRNVNQTSGEKTADKTGVSASSANNTGTQGNASAPPMESKENTAEKEEKEQKKSPASYKPRFRPGITPKQKE